MKTSKVVVVGSINADQVYRVEQVPSLGQSLPAMGYERHLGGKGMNQAWAMWQAGLKSVQMHAIIGQADGQWILAELNEAGFNTTHIRQTSLEATGQVMIMIQTNGETASVYHFAANLTWNQQDWQRILDTMTAGDWLIVQNEINGVEELIAMGRARGGLRIVWNPAPALSPNLSTYSQVDYLVVNEAEAMELTKLFSCLNNFEALREAIKVPNLIITLGAEGVVAWLHGQRYRLPAALKVEAIDTVGAGDCFLGYLIAGWQHLGLNDEQALVLAMQAAALTCTRPGAMAAIPRLDEVIRQNE